MNSARLWVLPVAAVGRPMSPRSRAALQLQYYDWRDLKVRRRHRHSGGVAVWGVAVWGVAVWGVAVGRGRMGRGRMGRGRGTWPWDVIVGRGALCGLTGGSTAARAHRAVGVLCGRGRAGRCK